MLCLQLVLNLMRAHNTRPSQLRHYQTVQYFTAKTWNLLGGSWYLVQEWCLVTSMVQQYILLVCVPLVNVAYMCVFFHIYMKFFYCANIFFHLFVTHKKIVFATQGFVFFILACFYLSLCGMLMQSNAINPCATLENMR